MSYTKSTCYSIKLGLKYMAEECYIWKPWTFIIYHLWFKTMLLGPWWGKSVTEFSRVPSHCFLVSSPLAFRWKATKGGLSHSLEKKDSHWPWLPGSDTQKEKMCIMQWGMEIGISSTRHCKIFLQLTARFSSLWFLMDDPEIHSLLFLLIHTIHIIKCSNKNDIEINSRILGPAY